MNTVLNGSKLEPIVFSRSEANNPIKQTYCEAIQSPKKNSVWFTEWNTFSKMFDTHVKPALRFSRRSCKILPRDNSRRSCHTTIIMVGNQTSSNINRFQTSYLHTIVKVCFIYVQVCTSGILHFGEGSSI